MTHFEKTYLMSRPSKLAMESTDDKKDIQDFTEKFNKQREENSMLMEYKELDRLSMELEKEIQAVKAVRMEMEKYKLNFAITVKDEATKKIQEVINEIDKMFK